MPKIVNPCSDHEKTIFYEHAKGRETPFSVIPAKVPRQARDPELAERAGIQESQELLDPGFRRGDALEGFSHDCQIWKTRKFFLMLFLVWAFALS